MAPVHQISIAPFPIWHRPRGPSPQRRQTSKIRPDRIAATCFYAAWSTPVVHDTRSGLRIDARCRVLDLGGEPIRGLYSGGETAGGFSAHGLARAVPGIHGRPGHRDATRITWVVSEHPGRPPELHAAARFFRRASAGRGLRSSCPKSSPHPHCLAGDDAILFRGRDVSISPPSFPSLPGRKSVSWAGIRPGLQRRLESRPQRGQAGTSRGCPRCAGAGVIGPRGPAARALGLPRLWCG
jgi:hypothetical protein